MAAWEQRRIDGHKYGTILHKSKVRQTWRKIFKKKSAIEVGVPRRARQEFFDCIAIRARVPQQKVERIARGIQILQKARTDSQDSVPQHRRAGNRGAIRLSEVQRA